MTHLDLFSGIGGFALAARWAGIQTVQFVEIDGWCQKVLAKNFPGVLIHGDIKTFHAGAGTADLLTGGFPCQPVSCAGKRRGAADDRWLWPEMARVIGEVRPRWVLGENVPGIINMGLDGVLTDLESLGYEVWTVCIPACAIGAPHRRMRVWIVAHAERDSDKSRLAWAGHSQVAGGSGDVAHAARECCGAGLRGGESGRDGRGQSADGSCTDAADTDGGGCDGKPGEQRQGSPERRWIAESGEDAPHSEVARLERADTAMDSRTAGRAAESGCGGWQADWWAVEPGMGGTLDGFSSWLDGNRGLTAMSHECIMAYVNQEKGTSHEAKNERPEEVLCALRHRIGEETLRTEIGGSLSLSPETVLFAYLCKLSDLPPYEAWLQLARAETPQSSVRSLRADDKLDGTPHRSGTQPQRPAEYPDALQTLSRLLARHSEKAWATYRRENATVVLRTWGAGWESGFARVADGVPRRVDRLRGLGNAIVPQVAYELMRFMLEVDA